MSEIQRLQQRVAELETERLVIMAHLNALKQEIPATFETIRAALRDKGWIEETGTESLDMGTKEEQATR